MDKKLLSKFNDLECGPLLLLTFSSCDSLLDMFVKLDSLTRICR